MIKDYKDKEFEIECDCCKGTYKHKVPVDFVPRFIPEFQQYENYKIECPHCKQQGKQVITHININLPPGDYDEEEIEVMISSNELNERKKVRDFMWDFRPDLKKLDRTTFNLARKKQKAEIERVKEEHEWITSGSPRRERITRDVVAAAKNQG
jgi:hypothetical protein